MNAVAAGSRSGTRADAAAADSRLYDLVGLALSAYVRARYRVRVLGAPFRLEKRQLVVSSHRSDDDVPLLVGALYRQAHGVVRRNAPVHFAVRDDLFGPGFFAGYPRGVPRLVRHLVFPLDVGPVLRRWLPCHPIRSAAAMHLVDLLRDHPERPLEELLPPPLLEPLLARSARLGRARPRRARDVLDGDHADLLWRWVAPEELAGPAAEASWRARRAAATHDFRELVEVLRAGGALLVFPEGRPSPDGTLGPLLGGVGALVRRGRPRTVVPLAPAYDPLVEGRPLALVGVGAPVEPSKDPQAALALLRRTTPLTVAASLAAALADGDDPEARLAADVEAAQAERRPYEPELADASARRARLAAARRLAVGRDLSRLEREYRSARA